VTEASDSVPGIAPGPGYIGHDELRRYFGQAAKHEARAAAVIHRAEVTETGSVLTAGEFISTTNQASGAILAWFVPRASLSATSRVEGEQGSSSSNHLHRGSPGLQRFRIGMRPWKITDDR
jgi:hypothetical protein